MRRAGAPAELVSRHTAIGSLDSNSTVRVEAGPGEPSRQRAGSMAGSETDAEYTQFGTLKVAEPTASAGLLDTLIAGAGPAGTAAVMRALELGLRVLVIDAEDLLTKVRDFHEGKDILPDYGVRADNRPFPPGGERVNA